MNKTINILLLFWFTLNCFESKAQHYLVLDSSNINIETGAFMQVVGGVQFNPTSAMENNGVVQLSDDWINNSNTTGLVLDAPGKVVMNGAIQNIGGFDVTQFYNLDLLNSGAIKNALVDVNITNNLNLTNAIFETNQSLVHLQNPAIDSLQWSNGFVSGQNLEGYFLRTTNSIDTYPFPVGSSILNGNYRVVEVVPTTADSSVFGVRLGDFDASNEIGVSASGSVAPFDIMSKEIVLGELNPQFFHSIHRFFGVAEANSKIYFYDTDADGLVTHVANWDQINDQWLDASFSVSPVNGASFINYGSPNRVAISNLVLDFANDQYILSELDLVLPTGVTFNNDGFNDVFVIENLDQYPNNELEIYNRWGELIYKASPYLNDWNGTNQSNKVKLQGVELQSDTYYYLLKLSPESDHIKNFLEIIND